MASGTAISGRTLAGLTGAVVIAHALVLQNMTLVLEAQAPLVTRAFTTRTLEIRPEPPVTAPAPPAPPPAPNAPAPRLRAPRSMNEAQPAAPAPAEPPLQSGPIPIAQEEVPRYDLAAPLANPVPEAQPAATAASTPAPQQLAQAEPAIPAAIVAGAAATPSAPPAAALPRDQALEARSYAVPGSTRLKFDATGRADRNSYNALGELLWLHDGKNYEARLELSIIFRSRVLTSSGQITADGLAPETFSDKYRAKVAAHFDRGKGLASFSANTPDVPLQPGAQDQLSVFVQLAALIAGEPSRYPNGTTIGLQTVGPRSAEVWAFTVDSQEKLYLPGGSLDTLKLIRNPRKEFDQKVEVWLAPSLSYLPARIRITQTNGDFVDQQWRATAAP